MSRRRTEKILLGGIFGPPVRSKVIIEAKTAAYTCLNDDSGKFFTTEGAGGSVTFTLPAVSLTGWHARFCNLAAQDMVISSAEGDNIVGHTNAAEDLSLDSITFSQANMRTGNVVHIISTGTKWIAEVGLFARNSVVTTQHPAVAT